MVRAAFRELEIILAERACTLLHKSISEASETGQIRTPASSTRPDIPMHAPEVTAREAALPVPELVGKLSSRTVIRTIASPASLHLLIGKIELDRILAFA